MSISSASGLWPSQTSTTTYSPSTWEQSGSPSARCTFLSDRDTQFHGGEIRQVREHYKQLCMLKAIRKGEGAFGSAGHRTPRGQGILNGRTRTASGGERTRRSRSKA
nr:hypothetical protein [Haloquadratum walsbyi]